MVYDWRSVFVPLPRDTFQQDLASSTRFFGLDSMVFSHDFWATAPFAPVYFLSILKARSNLAICLPKLENMIISIFTNMEWEIGRTPHPPYL